MVEGVPTVFEVLSSLRLETPPRKPPPVTEIKLAEEFVMAVGETPETPSISVNKPADEVTLVPPRAVTCI